MLGSNINYLNARVLVVVVLVVASCAVLDSFAIASANNAGRVLPVDEQTRADAADLARTIAAGIPEARSRIDHLEATEGLLRFKVVFNKGFARDAGLEQKMLYETVPLMERIVASIEGDVVTMTFAAASAEQAEVAYREVSALLRAERLVSAEQRQGLADEVATVERLAEEQEASNHKAYHTAMWANRWNEAEAERLEQREALIAEQEAQIAELKMAIALALQRAFGVEGMPSAV
eukprot:m51a1_g12686 hypothetical protein (235) ;mRNA; f:1493-2295